MVTTAQQSEPAVVRFDEPECDRHDLVGGKAASLGRMIKNGLPVPPGFVVTTRAYELFVEQSGLHQAILERIHGTGSDRSLVELESAAKAIHRMIVDTDIPPALAKEIAEAYAPFDDAYVAVRSSGTAEDLADASFAGLHETYLDIRTRDAVLDAVRRCWASMWTARAIGYREQNGIDQSGVRLAVAVQQMVRSDVAGVMFTANPRTLRADECVINASWGLGETVVLGMVTPDEYVVDRPSRRIKTQSLGTKEVRIDRDPDATSGTLERAVPRSEQDQYTLSSSQIAELLAVGDRVAAMYDERPQDIEWSLSDDTFYVVQARPITGAEFCWDEDCDDWQAKPERDGDLWTHSFASSGWNGAITPLFYSVRAKEFTDGLYELCRGAWGVPDMAEERWFKFRRATVYLNSTLSEKFVQYLYPAPLRPMLLHDIAPSRYEAVLASDFDLRKYLGFLVRLKMLEPDKHFYSTFATMNDFYANRVAEADGKTTEELRALTDDQLVAHIDEIVGFAKEYIDVIWTGFFIFSPTMFATLAHLLQKWYRGSNENVMQELVSGLPERTAQFDEDLALWEVTERLRGSADLRELLWKHDEPAAFFAALETTDEGRRFKRFYEDTLLIPYSHRGHADRDIYYTRRAEDPAVDHRAFRALVRSAEAEPSPEEAHRRLVERRLLATDEVIDNLRRQPLGAIKVELFKLTHDWILRLLVCRDTLRSYGDRFTFSKKRAFAEVGRRCQERGQLTGDEDFYFLAWHELLELFRGAPATPLVHAKIAARGRAFHAALNREIDHPFYLEGDRPVTLAEGDSAQDGVLRGVGIANGGATGPARVIRRLEDIGELQKGDILVCNATDPGWTPVFPLVSGVVIETGGVLAHAACLSREFGIPCVSLPGAMRKIEDGIEIRLDGSAGEIRLCEPAVSG